MQLSMKMRPFMRRSWLWKHFLKNGNIVLVSPIGNGFLQVLDWGKFALTVYDRLTLSGVRAWLNPDGLANYPMVRRWFERSKGGSTQKPAFEELASEILSGGSAFIGYRSVRLHRALKGSDRVATGRCPRCGESYPLHLGPSCPACQGKAYYI